MLSCTAVQKSFQELTLGKALSKAATVAMIVVAALMMSGHLSVSTASIAMFAGAGIKVLRLLYKVSQGQESKRSLLEKIALIILPALLVGGLGIGHVAVSAKSLGLIFIAPMSVYQSIQLYKNFQSASKANKVHREEEKYKALLQGIVGHLNSESFGKEILSLKGSYPEKGDAYLITLTQSEFEAASRSLPDSCGSNSVCVHNTKNMLFYRFFIENILLKHPELGPNLNFSDELFQSIRDLPRDDYIEFVRLEKRNEELSKALHAFFQKHPQLMILPQILQSWRTMETLN